MVAPSDWPDATLRSFHFKDISIAGKSGRNRLPADADNLAGPPI